MLGAGQRGHRGGLGGGAGPGCLDTNGAGTLAGALRKSGPGAGGGARA